MASSEVNSSFLVGMSSIIYKIARNESFIDDNQNKSGRLMVYDNIPKQLSPLYIAWLCVAGVILIPGVFANCMILAALFKVEKLRIASNYLIGSLAVADLMMMLGMVGFVLSDLLRLDISPKVNKFLWPSIDLMVGSASISNLAGVSFDRAVAVFYPMQYHERCNVKQAFFTIKCIWAFSLLMFVLSMLRCVIDIEAYHLSILYIGYVCSFILPFAVIMISYGLILSATIKNVKLSRSIEKAVYNAALRMSNNATLKNERIHKLRIQELKIAGNFIVILLPFVATWGFFFGTHFYEDITKKYQRSELHEWFIVTLPWISSSINPLIYILSIASLRTGCKKLLCGGSYFARAKETIIVTMHSKRSSAVDKGICQVSSEKRSLLGRIGCFSNLPKLAKLTSNQDEAPVRKKDSTVVVCDENLQGTGAIQLCCNSTKNVPHCAVEEKNDISIV